MKLSRLAYHNGAVKVEVYQKGQQRKRWNTGVRVNQNLLNKDNLIKPNNEIDWQGLNLKIFEEKDKVDKAIREVIRSDKHLDVLKVFALLEQDRLNKKENRTKQQQRESIADGTLKRKLKGAIQTLKTSINSNRAKENNLATFGTGEAQTGEHLKKLEARRRLKFLNHVNKYIASELQVTQEATIAKLFVKYLNEGTMINVNNLRRHFTMLEFMVNNPIVIDDVNDVWINNLLKALEYGLRGLKVNSNSTDWLFGRFQCFWTWALNNNYTSKRIHWKRFKRLTFKPGFVWINEERIKELATTTFKLQRYEFGRMAYLIMCLTGMRHSDFHSLTPSDIVSEGGRKYIHKVNKKTKTEFKVEVHELILPWISSSTILKNIKMSHNPCKSNALLNDNIREMAESLGWTEPVRLQTDVDQWETKPFYEWMNCHSARHSAICLWLTHGVSNIAILKWTGWKGGSKMITYYADILGLNNKESINTLVKI